MSTAISFYALSRYDPTHTLTLRNAFAREMRSRFRSVASSVIEAIMQEDRLDFRPSFGTSDSLVNRIDRFMSWFDGEVNERVLGSTVTTLFGRTSGSWMDTYVNSAYQRGILRGRQELRNAGYNVPPVNDAGGVLGAFANPYHQERVGLLRARVYNDLKGIVDNLRQQVARVLAQSMADRQGPQEIVKLLVSIIKGPAGRTTDILGRFMPSLQRADLLSRTEVIRIHHNASTQEYRNWAVSGVKVLAEWATADDEHVCEACGGMEGVVFELDDIENMIPAHPACRCVALPLEVGE